MKTVNICLREYTIKIDNEDNVFGNVKIIDLEHFKKIKTQLENRPDLYKINYNR